MQMATDFVGLALASPIADIGQLDPAAKVALKRAVKSGKLVSWRGKWAPVTGADYGLGPDKTCYGTAHDRINVRGI
jgi:hypothetical protein